MPTLEITTMVGCPQQCTFCPQDKLTAAYTSDKRQMSFIDFCTIVNKLPAYVRVDFSGMSEPWANRYATEMLQYVLGTGRKVAVYTTMQGMRDPIHVAALLDKHRDQVENVVIHLPDARGNMRGFSNKDHDWRVSVFEDLLPWAKFMTMDETAEAVDMPWHAIDRAGSLDRAIIGHQPVESAVSHKTPVSCTYTPFYDQNVVLPNGDVLLCCMDYGMRHVIGNLLEQEYFDLFKNSAMGHVTCGNMQSDGDTICHSCSRARLHGLEATNNQFWTWSA